MTQKMFWFRCKNSCTVAATAAAFCINLLVHNQLSLIGGVQAFRLSSISSSLSPCRNRVIVSTNGRMMTSGSTLLKAQLTERQLQFWEDVENGLDTIKQSDSSINIDRIRRFGESARGEIDPPAGYAPGHEPSEEHIEGLTAKPFWDVTDDPQLFPWAIQLEKNANIIQKEFEQKLMINCDNNNNNNEKNIFASDSAWQNQVMGNGWSAIRLQRLGIWNKENCREFPETYKLLQSLEIPLAVRGVCFAKQVPKSGVEPHSDGRNFILTTQLGLAVPVGCYIEVGDSKNGERRCWEKGKLTTIDTSFLHSTKNPSETEDRYILIIDFWHPELSESEKTALEFLYDTRNKFESGLVPFRTPTNKSRQIFGKRKKAKQEQEGGIGLWWNSIINSGEN